MRNLVWFRNDLRVHDNISLQKALIGDEVIGVYCFDNISFNLDLKKPKNTELNF